MGRPEGKGNAVIPAACVLLVLGFLARCQAVIGGVTFPALWLAAAAVALAALAGCLLAARLLWRDARGAAA